MTTEDTSRVSSTRLGTIAEQIDGICDDFECRWRNGEHPMIEWYLNRIEEPHRRKLFGELLGIDLYWRRRVRDFPEVDEYLRRFAGHEDVIRREFQHSDVVPVGAAPPRDEASRGSTSPSTRSRPATAATPVASAEFAPSRFGNYELLAEIGRGRIATVYRAKLRGTDRVVALKLIRREHLPDLAEAARDSVFNRFEQEVRAISRLQHENLGAIYDVGHFGGQPFIAMRLSEGRSLATCIDQAPLAPRRAATHLRAIASAVAEAHAHGVVHGDIRPENILVDSKGDRPKLFDFGVAHLPIVPSDDGPPAGAIGQPMFQAPEALWDAGRGGPGVDVYALGATLYAALTGRPPFLASSPADTRRQVRFNSPAPPRSLNPAIDPDLEVICLTALERDPTQRYRSAQALVDDLSRFLDGQSLQAPAAGRLAKWKLWCARHPVGVTAAIVLVAGAAIVLGASKDGRQRHSTKVESLRAKNAALELNLKESSATLERLLARVDEADLLDDPGIEPLRREMFADGLQYDETRLARESPQLTGEERAGRLERIGRFTAEVEAPEAALPWLEQARSLRAEAALRWPDDRRRSRSLGETLASLGLLGERAGHYDAAREALAEAIERLAAEPPATYTESSDRASWRRLAHLHERLAVVELARQKREAAQQSLAEAERIRASLLAGVADDPPLKLEAAVGRYWSAKLAQASGDAARARVLVDGAIASLRPAEGQPPATANSYHLANCYLLMAELCASANDPTEAEACYRRALDELTPLASRFPAASEFQAALARLLVQQGRWLATTNRLDEANVALRQAIGIGETLMERSPARGDHRQDLARALFAEGDVLEKQGAKETARQSIRRATELASGGGMAE